LGAAAGCFAAEQVQQPGTNPTAKWKIGEQWVQRMAKPLPTQQVCPAAVVDQRCPAGYEGDHRVEAGSAFHFVDR
jgi:hypothetical protein